MASSQKPNVSEQEIKNASHVWNGFVTLSKYGIYAICGILILMALFLL